MSTAKGVYVPNKTLFTKTDAGLDLASWIWENKEKICVTDRSEIKFCKYSEEEFDTGNNIPTGKI